MVLATIQRQSHLSLYELVSWISQIRNQATIISCLECHNLPERFSIDLSGKYPVYFYWQTPWNALSIFKKVSLGSKFGKFTHVYQHIVNQWVTKYRAAIPVSSAAIAYGMAWRLRPNRPATKAPRHGHKAHTAVPLEPNVTAVSDNPTLPTCLQPSKGGAFGSGWHGWKPSEFG